MDDTTIFPPSQPGASQPQQPGPEIHQPLAETQQPSIPVPSQPIQPIQPEPVAAPQVSQPSEGPRLTLNDLYGPSQPQPAPQASAEVPSPEPIQSVPPPVEPVVPMPAVPQQEPVVPSTPEPPSQSFEPSLPLQSVKQPQPEVATPKQHEEDHNSGGGFHIMSILKFLIIGAVVIGVLFLVWTLSSFLFSKKGAGNGQVTLNYWGLWEDTNVMQPIISDFEKQHPNITIVYTKEDPKEYTNRLLTRIQQGNGPDIFRLHNTWVYPLQNILLPLPSSVLTQQALASYPPVVSSDLVKNGALYGLPLEMDTLSLFVNKDIFAHAGASVPTTWDSFITTAKALTVKDPNGHIQTSGAAIGTYGNISHAPDIVSMLLLQNGADMQKLTSSNANDALSFYTSFAHPDSNVWDDTLPNSLQAFAQGNVAMYFGYSYDILAIKAIAPSLNFGVYPVPHLPGRNITVSSYWVEGVSNRSKHPKEALEFMQYLAQKDTQQNIYTQEAKTRSFGELYAPTDLAASLTGNPLLAPFVSQYKDAKSSIFAGETQFDEYNGSLNQYLANAINSILKDTSVDSASVTLSQGVAQITSQYAPKTQQ